MVVGMRMISGTPSPQNAKCQNISDFMWVKLTNLVRDACVIFIMITEIDMI